MADENNFGCSSSQESLPLSQETFQYIWNDLYSETGYQLVVSDNASAQKFSGPLLLLTSKWSAA